MAIQNGWMGRFYEDFQIGDVYVHPIGRTLTDVDNTWFTLLTNNNHQIHFNEDYASKTEFGKCLMNSALTFAVVGGMSVIDVSENAVANLGWEHVHIPAPVFAGDTLYADTTVLGKRESKSRPDAGIVRVETRGYNQSGTTVLEFVRRIFIYKKDHAPRNAVVDFRNQLAANRRAPVAADDSPEVLRR